MSETEHKKYTAGFRVSPHTIADLFAPSPPPTRRERLRRFVAGIRWRATHAWNALVHNDCDGES